MLRGVDLNVHKGDLIALYGPSGSGKTTLLNLIGALDFPTQGEVEVCGAKVSHMAEAGRTRIRRRHLGFIFQNYTLLSTYTASENIDLALRLVLPPIGFRQRHERTAAALRAMGLSSWANHVPDQLSGGQQQRVSIARALAMQPDLILADEPTNGLDSRTAQRVLGLFQGLAHRQGTAFLIVSHDPQVTRYVDRSFDLHDGRLNLRQTTEPREELAHEITEA